MVKIFEQEGGHRKRDGEGGNRKKKKRNNVSEGHTNDQCCYIPGIQQGSYL